MVDYWAVASICGFLPRPTLYEAHSRGFGFACMEFFTIRYLRRHFGGYRWERWWGINGIGRRGAT